MTDFLDCIEINPEASADATVIWLHGLGASGHDFEGIVPQLNLPPEFAVRFILPHAPSIPITINNGYVMPGWFDILELQAERKFNLRQLLTSALAMHALIDREIDRGINSERIVLAGFSQGGAVNYQAGLTYDKPLCGILALSTYFPTADVIEVHPANAQVPIMIHHGINDPVLPVEMAENSKRYLEELGFHPHLQLYRMEHNVIPEQIQDISVHIQSLLG
ncbi:MAG: carboxylesterase [Pseudohongiellaceae bacterium]